MRRKVQGIVLPGAAAAPGEQIFGRDAGIHSDELIYADVAMNRIGLSPRGGEYRAGRGAMRRVVGLGIRVGLGLAKGSPWVIVPIPLSGKCGASLEGWLALHRHDGRCELMVFA